MKKRPLSLHEEVLLLALDNEKGTPTPGTWMQAALAGAILGEFFQTERIRTVLDGKRDVIEVMSSEPLGNKLLDDYLALIVASKQTQPAKFWAGLFSARGDLIPRTAEGLCDLGVLRMDERKVLFLFTRKDYPEVEERYEVELLERLRAAIFEDAAVVPPRTQMIVAIANQTGLLRAHFDDRELLARKGRIDSIVQGHLAGEAIQGAVETANMNLFMLILMA